MNMEQSQAEMTTKMETLIPENYRTATNLIMPRRQPFEILYRLNCDNLCADFHEDLEFRYVVINKSEDFLRDLSLCLPGFHMGLQL